MSTQAIVNIIFMIIIMCLIIADGIFLFASVVNEEWGVLIGALCGAVLLILIHALTIIKDL